MPLFCRHNRLTVNCPICSRDLQDELRAKAPSRSRSTPSRSGTRSRGSSSPRGVVTRKLARPADDGYRNPLVPGLRATADAERLGAALAGATARLEPPGPFPAVAEVPDQEEATWLAFLLALGVDDGPSWASGENPPQQARTAAAYRAWAERAGSQEAAVQGDDSGRRSAASRACSSASRCPASPARSGSSC